MQVQPPKMFQFGLFFLLLQKPNDRDHKVRLAMGNGLRADVWREFVRRFGDIHINEFYASNGNRIILISNYLKCKWVECPNQKTKTG